MAYLDSEYPTRTLGKYAD